MIRNFESGDIVTTGQQFAEGKRAAALAVVYRLKMFLGEYFLDVTQGTAWFQGILGKAPQGSAEVVLKQRILRTDGIADIIKFDFNPILEQRRIELSCRVVYDDGEEGDLEISEELT